MPLDRLVIYHVKAPLARPSPHGGGALQVDSFIALAAFADGSCRVGESTPVPGQGHETPELLTREYGLLARHGHMKAFLDRNHCHPLVTLPILTCLDPTLGKPVGGQVRVCPLLEWNDPLEIAERVALLAGQGHKVIRINITRDVRDTRAIVRETIRAGHQCGVRFRYDAHGSLDLAGATALVRWLDDATTELLDQPFPVAAWRQMASLYESCPIPLMLDESIVDASHVFLAADCADFIKLTLARNGSPSRLLELIRQAREIGLKIILGNGVQGMIGCWLEGQVQIMAGLDTPGEMSAFRELRDSYPAGLVEATVTGFTAKADLTWPAVESALKAHCLTEYRIPSASVSASCA
ncbi:MAG TPA: enolase C-terminal domain-like protein [Gemmataceae bacterium]|jgi:O-succinylbenzoate synthase|nr:enolase C-terminal domain-like protein [Gemmataceae bacterium]